MFETRRSLAGVIVVSALLAACSAGGVSPAPKAAPGPTVATTPASNASAPSASSSSPPATSPAALSTVTVTATTAAAPSAQPAVQVLPRVIVKGGEGRSAPASVQRFADDVADGAIDSVIRNCWTRSPSTIRSALSLAGRQTILAKLQTPMQGAQGGWYWGTGQAPLGFPWSEVDSSYACPDLSSGQPLTRDELALLLARLEGRRKGTPIRPSDTDQKYPLLCDFTNTLGPGGSLIQSESEVTAAAWGALRTVAAGPIKSTTGQGVTVTPATSSRPKLVFQSGVGGWCWESATP